MFNWNLFLLLVAVTIPGICIVIPSSLRTIKERFTDSVPTDKPMPPMGVMILASSVQSLVLISIFAAVGTALAGKVGFGAPFFESLIAGEGIADMFRMQLAPALLAGCLGAIVFLMAYYLFFRRKLDEETVRSWDSLRMQLGIWGRILYGGIFEEILIRWGLMTLVVWFGTLLVGETTALVVWVAIVLTGILFGLGHLPGYLAAGCQKSSLFIAAMLSLNLWASVIFGWLYWQYGLLAAMLAHMLFHIFWYPFDLRMAREH